MAKNNEAEGCAFIIALVASIAGLPIFLVSYFVRKHFADKYDLKNVPVRVSDTTSNIFASGLATICGAGFFILLSALFIYAGFFCIFIEPHYLWAPFWLLVGILFLICAMPFAGLFAIHQIGMLVFPKTGIFVIPADTARNTFSQNIFEGRWFTDRFHMEELNLADIDRITREGGSSALIHGKFGTRSITWSNKQKRDECITTLERYTKRRLTTIY